MFYSAKTGGFYDAAIHGDNIPKDAVEISTEDHAALIDGQSKGKVITADKKGNPVLTDPLPPTAEELAAQVAALRQAAYTAEADPLFFMYQRGKATKEEWLAKIEEIKTRYPAK